MLAGTLLLAWRSGMLSKWAAARATYEPREVDVEERPSTLTAIYVLVGAALLEVAVNRIAVPLLRPTDGSEPPGWHTALDYVGLFLFYFVGALTTFVLVVRIVAALHARRAIREVIAHGVLALATLFAAISLIAAVPEVELTLELLFAVAIVALVASAFANEHDLGVQIGLPLLLIPFLIHLYFAVDTAAGEPEWPTMPIDGGGTPVPRISVMALCLTALITPYCFAPRPFARAVTRPLPIILAVGLAIGIMVFARLAYPTLVRTAALAIGVQMTSPLSGTDPRLPLYLLALATLTWTLSSCAISSSPSRRLVGLGIGLLLLGGYGFKWPHHYLLPLLGFTLIAEAARRVRDEELTAMPLMTLAPPIADATWSVYVGTVAAGLRRTLGDVHSLTTRGEGGLASSLIIGDLGGIPVRTRIERLEGSVFALDVVLGRDIDELRGATLTLWSIPSRELGANPPGPPASPPFRSSDAAFDEKFRLRGASAAFERLLDEDLRARAVATLDGWLAYWERDGLRYRVYPGRGAPLDHPLPISDLALGRVPPNAERLVAVIELLSEIAVRGVDVEASQPTELDAVGTASGASGE
ncbi:MAG: hypothetical protein KIT31_02570 [Deltaproteobacteria bacterium]|nr:hypothetical protein [Deltaproteobacteria bacterium]